VTNKLNVHIPQPKAGVSFFQYFSAKHFQDDMNFYVFCLRKKTSNINKQKRVTNIFNNFKKLLSHFQ